MLCRPFDTDLIMSFFVKFDKDHSTSYSKGNPKYINEFFTLVKNNFPYMQISVLEEIKYIVYAPYKDNAIPVIMMHLDAGGEFSHNDHYELFYMSKDRKYNIKRITNHTFDYGDFHHFKSYWDWNI